MNYEQSYDAYQLAADLAEMAQDINFGGNDAAGLRNGYAGDDSIEAFVQRIAKFENDVRQQVRKEIAASIC